ncbi:MAG: hypothetical protein WBB25_19590, partial [Sulfitobacter sp.]
PLLLYRPRVKVAGFFPALQPRMADRKLRDARTPVWGSRQISYLIVRKSSMARRAASGLAKLKVKRQM